MKPEPKPGDRVRLTMEGVFVRRGDDGFVVKLDGNVVHYFGPVAQSSPTFKIEILEAPIAVGDRVIYLAITGAILAIDGDFAWVRWSSGARGGHPLSSLKRIEPSHED
jgi:hypothetical protein